MSIEFLSNFFDLYQEDHMGGFFSVNVEKYIEASLNAKALLHTWNKPYLIVL